MGGKTDKAFLSLGSQPLLAYSLRVFQECSEIDSIVLVVRRDQQVAAKGVVKVFGVSKVRAIVAGGAMRQVSVAQGLQAVDPDTRIVCVHDAARPCVTSALIQETIHSARRHGSGVAATRITDTVKQVNRGQVVTETLDRDRIWTVQTPQTFRLELLQRAFDALAESGETVTDEAAALERIGEEVRLVSTNFPNIKITTADDLPVAAALLGIQ